MKWTTTTTPLQPTLPNAAPNAARRVAVWLGPRFWQGCLHWREEGTRIGRNLAEQRGVYRSARGASS